MFYAASIITIRLAGEADLPSRPKSAAIVFSSGILGPRHSCKETLLQGDGYRHVMCFSINASFASLRNSPQRTDKDLTNSARGGAYLSKDASIRIAAAESDESGIHGLANMLDA